MTTVIYDKGVLYSDSLGTRDHIRQPSLRKIFTIENELNCAVAFAGNIAQCYGFLDVFSEKGFNLDKEDIDRFSECFSLIILPGRSAKDMLLFEGSQGDFLPLDPKGQYSIGSGYEVALGALKSGANGLKAMKAVIELDVYSGPPVQKMFFNYKNREWEYTPNLC